jgi:hypothetical protein
VHRRGAFARLSQQLWRADGTQSIVGAIPPVFTDPAAVFSTCRRCNATSSKRIDRCDPYLMTSVAESAKCDLTLRNEPLKRGTKLEETVKSYRQPSRLIGVRRGAMLDGVTKKSCDSNFAR